MRAFLLIQFIRKIIKVNLLSHKLENAKTTFFIQGFFARGQSLYRKNLQTLISISTTGRNCKTSWGLRFMTMEQEIMILLLVDG